MTVKFYTTYCPACDIVEAMLKQNNIDYEVIDDDTIVSEVAQERHITHVPFVQIDDRFYTSAQLRDYIKTNTQQ